ncbi:efflux RND transporter periplasmic adaptor subunit [Candidatus Amoebophilus asiaticus]|nr:efflux RND transporter periplasmic adaptor subunit [Candidatus Amoebophilus asiaticus]
MNKLIPFLTIVILADSCSSGSQDGVELTKKIRLRDSCLAVVDRLNDQIRGLNKEIAELDTTRKNNHRERVVSTKKLTRGTFWHYFEVQGTVQADKNILIAPETAGVVKKIKVVEGQRVRAGQTLMILDADVIQQSINEIKTMMDLANDLFERQQKLWDQKIGSEVQYLEAKNKKESLQNKLSTLQAQLDKAYIKAPEDGIIDEIIPKIGEMASPPIPVIRLVDLSKVYIKSDVSENYIKAVKKGASVIVQFPSLDEELEARITQVGNFINPNNRTFKIRINLENPDNLFKPNLLAVIKIKDFEQDSVIAVPSPYILADAGGKEYVFIIDREGDKKRAKKVFVESGLSYKGETMMKKGLNGNEELITEGSRTVTDKEIVSIKN